MGNPWVKISDLYPYLLKPIPASMDRGFTGTGAGFLPICRVTLPHRAEIGTGKIEMTWQRGAYTSSLCWNGNDTMQRGVPPSSMYQGDPFVCILSNRGGGRQREPSICISSDGVVAVAFQVLEGVWTKLLMRSQILICWCLLTKQHAIEEPQVETKVGLWEECAAFNTGFLFEGNNIPFFQLLHLTVSLHTT